MDHARAGDVLSKRYRLLKLVGKGRASAVFEAEDLEDGGRLAVKVMDGDSKRSSVPERPLVFELELAARLDDPRIVLPDRLGVSESGWPYVTMELSPGRTLRSILASEGRLAPPRAVALIAQVLLALEHAHARGVVHRDLNPENVLVEREEGSGAEVVRIIDFEEALLIDHPRKESTDRVGGGIYQAPELVSGRFIDGRVDVYACAVMLYELIAGTPPPRLDAFSLSTPPPRLSELDGSIDAPRALEAAIAHGLEPQPQSRFESAAAFRRALEDAFGPGALARGAAAAPEASGAPRPALLLEVEGTPGLKKVFVVAGSRLALGRNREDLQRGIRNDVVLRVLPCRDRGRDPENFAATVRMSQSQLEVALDEGGASALDRSSRGTQLDGERLPRGRFARLPGSFRLGLGDGALALAGNVAAAGVAVPLAAGISVTAEAAPATAPPRPSAETAGAGGTPGALVVLRRIANAADHWYVLAGGPLVIGKDGAGARVALVDGAFRVAAVGGAAVSLGGTQLAGGGDHALEAGLRVDLGGVGASLKEPDDSDFSAL
jgi:hypothetical protein